MMTNEHALEWAQAFDSNPVGFTRLFKAHEAWMNSTDRRWASPASRELESVRADLLKRFAYSRGWKVARKSFGVEALHADKFTRGGASDMRVIDHAEYFALGRRPIGILSHSYAPWDACVQFATTHGLLIERLAYSWYYPFHAIAALFTRDPNLMVAPVPLPAPGELCTPDTDARGRKLATLSNITQALCLRELCALGVENFTKRVMIASGDPPQWREFNDYDALDLRFAFERLNFAPVSKNLLNVAIKYVAGVLR